MAENQEGVKRRTGRTNREEEIRKRAYELYLEREFSGPVNDWLEAEAELLLRRRSF